MTKRLLHDMVEGTVFEAFCSQETQPSMREKVGAARRTHVTLRKHELSCVTTPSLEDRHRIGSD